MSVDDRYSGQPPRELRADAWERAAYWEARAEYWEDRAEKAEDPPDGEGASELVNAHYDLRIGVCDTCDGRTFLSNDGLLKRSCPDCRNGEFGESTGHRIVVSRRVDPPDGGDDDDG